MVKYYVRRLKEALTTFLKQECCPFWVPFNLTRCNSFLKQKKERGVREIVAIMHEAKELTSLADGPEQ